jgi:hypothetical protein
MILRLLAMIAANAASVLGARLLSRPFLVGDPAADAVIFLVLRLLLISAVILTAGATHGLSAGVLGSLGTVAFASLLLRLRMTGPRLPQAGSAVVGWIAGGATILFAIRLLLQVWFFAPHTEDVLSYHLPKIAEWIRAGGFTRELGVDNHATFPAGFELVETWWVVFLHHDVLIEMAGVEFLILAAAGAAALGVRLGLSLKQAYLAGFIYAMTPGLMCQATSCLNDGPVAALTVACFALLAHGASWGPVLVAMSLGLGVKATFGYALPGILLLAYCVRREPRSRKTSRVAAFSAAAFAIPTGAFWYVRNWVTYGNPIYPIGEQALPIQSQPKWSSFLGNLNSLLGDRLYDRGPYGAFLDGISGWGGVSFACGILGTVLWMRESSGIRKLGAAFLVSLAGVLLMSKGDDWFMRFCLFFPALLSIASVRLCETCRPVLPCVVIGLLFQFVGTCLPYDLPLKKFERLASQPWRSRSSSEIFEFKASDPVVGYFATNRGPAYCLYGPDFSRQVIYLRSRTPEGLEKEIREAGLRTIYLADLEIHDERLIEDCVKRGKLRRTGKHQLVAQP